MNTTQSSWFGIEKFTAASIDILAAAATNAAFSSFPGYVVWLAGTQLLNIGFPRLLLPKELCSGSVTSKSLGSPYLPSFRVSLGITA
ncbi:hypothetical protein B0T20DRAFT_387478 [Sordaria brevicollis]|uniref:Uncharacterized protein n=1 Tax=Sordaria brevicollis TaxID=83679 RepID=A0AAE0U2K0_SORBR|nr:hypothetical protein B0T20DRAFT_387478 [Sordaria brevicollis]